MQMKDEITESYISCNCGVCKIYLGWLDRIDCYDVNMHEVSELKT